MVLLDSELVVDAVIFSVIVVISDPVCSEVCSRLVVFMYSVVDPGIGMVVLTSVVLLWVVGWEPVSSS